jgi:HK97 family phage major capsid protein
MTILGRMGQNGIPGPRVVPFRTRLISQTSGGSGYWVGEGAPKPMTKFDFTGTTLEPLKVANIAVVTMELLRDSSPSAEAIVRDSLAAALAERLDIDFVDPTKTASAGVSPASITNGVTPIVSSGTDADAVRCDIATLLQSYAAANNPPTTGVLVMSASLAIALMGLRNALGQREFPDITMNGGILEGFPVVTSQYVSGFADTAGEYVFMINASDIWLGDMGGVTVDMSDQASLQFLDNPTNNGTGSTTATSMISLWQTNCVGFRAERTINWAKRRDSAVAVLSGVNWTACAA